MKIQVLGSGCPTCKKLNEITIQAVKELGLTDDVEYLTGDKGTSKIIEMGIMSSPVLVIDDKPVIVGFTPDIEKIKNLLTKGGDASGNKGSGDGSACNCGGNC